MTNDRFLNRWKFHFVSSLGGKQRSWRYCFKFNCDYFFITWSSRLHSSTTLQSYSRWYYSTSSRSSCIVDTRRIRRFVCSRWISAGRWRSNSSKSKCLRFDRCFVCLFFQRFFFRSPKKKLSNYWKRFWIGRSVRSSHVNTRWMRWWNWAHVFPIHRSKTKTFFRWISMKIFLLFSFLVEFNRLWRIMRVIWI